MNTCEEEVLALKFKIISSVQRRTRPPLLLCRRARMQIEQPCVHATRFIFEFDEHKNLGGGGGGIYRRCLIINWFR